MKSVLFLSLVGISFFTAAQPSLTPKNLLINEKVTTLLAFESDIELLDASTSAIGFDRPTPRLLRLKAKEGHASDSSWLGVLSVIAEDKLYQFEVLYHAGADRYQVVDDRRGIPLSLSKKNSLESYLAELPPKGHRKTVTSGSDELEVTIQNLWSVNNRWILELSWKIVKAWLFQGLQITLVTGDKPPSGTQRIVIPIQESLLVPGRIWVMIEEPLITPHQQLEILLLGNKGSQMRISMDSGAISDFLD